MSNMPKLAFLAIGLFVTLVKQTDCLQCFRCTYNDLRTDTFIPDSVENWILDHFRLASDVRCVMDKFEQDQYIVNVRTCPEPTDPDRYMYKCAEIKGTTTGVVTYATFVDVTLEYHTIERDCVEVPKADPQYTDGRHDSLPSSGPARLLLEKTFEGLEIGNVQFSGYVEYTARTVQVPAGLQCPQCTYSRLESEGDSIFDAILRRFADINEPSCQLKKIEGDSRDISLRNCPAAPAGHVGKCWSVEGTVSAEIAGKKFHYKTVDRDCTSVSKDGASSSNSCHDTSDKPNLIVQTYQSLGLSGVTFKGQSCYSSNDWKAFAQALTGTATNLHYSHLFLFLFSTISILATIFIF